MSAAFAERVLGALFARRKVEADQIAAARAAPQDGFGGDAVSPLGGHGADWSVQPWMTVLDN